MTQASPPPESATDNENTTSPDLPYQNSQPLRAGPTTTFDSDASEKPVREKLKKTSIASISQHDGKTQERVTRSDKDDVTDIASAERESAPVDRVEDPHCDSIRGRPVKKRSFDHLETAQAEGDTTMANGSRTDRANGHARKRSRDLRLIEPVKGERQLRVAGATVEEEGEETFPLADPSASPGIDSEESRSSIATHLETAMEIEQAPAEAICQMKAENSPRKVGENRTDREMEDRTSSPRRKRSRDQLEADAHREQKIPATEEARAQRRSNELERTEPTEAIGATAAAPDSSLLTGHSSAHAVDHINRKVHGTDTAEEATPSLLESELIPVPPTDENKSASPMQQSTNTQSKTYPTAFASSGSAALSGSSNSLFGTLGASSTSATPPSPINSSKLESTNVSHFSEGKGARKTETAASGAFGSLAKPSSIGFSASEPSPFAISGAGKSSVFGGSVFGGGFGSGFSGGGKLTNFAAPVGDTYLGSINGAIKPIGSPTLEGNNDKENSDDEGEGPGENGNDGSEEVDELFHRQDVETGEDDETTVFSSRASLFIFKDKAWKEGGKGTFKFNINALLDPDSPPKSGRFIMRASQTFRVLLNAPVLKKMTVGDSRGKEPNGKFFSFGVVEDGILVPYLLKLSDIAESRKLYHEVRRLQESMPEG